MSRLRSVAHGYAAFLMAAALAGAPVSGLAQSRSMEIESFHADVRIRADGDIEVLESITVAFHGSWNGIFRTIPVEYRAPSGLQYRLALHLVSVTNEAGEELWRDESRQGLYRKIKIAVPGAENAVRTVNIRYTIPNALRFFDEHDELYWNVTGTEWPFPIHSATARIEVPSGVSGLRASTFVGGFGATEQAIAQQLDDGFYFEAGRPLGLREGLTVAVAWDPGVVRRPGIFERAWLLIRANLLFVFPLLSLFLMYNVWLSRGKDPERRSITPEYEPPEGLTPSEAGTLIDNSPDMRDITASIVDLAVRGYLKIEEVKESKLLGLFSSDDYRLVRIGEARDWRELHPHEEAVLSALFDGGTAQSVKISDLEHEFYEKLPGIKNGIFERLVQLKLYDRRPDHVLTMWVLVGFAVLVVSIGAFIAVANIMMLARGWSILAAVLTAVPVFVFGSLMPARTIRGARQFEKILGFQEFMERVEQDRFRRMITGPEMFERYLPYAMALGVDKKWAAAFEDLYREPPDWYVGTYPHGFRTTMFVTSLHSWSDTAGAALASGPRSSGGSGFSGGGGGGGFSGGGFGGGGGGGW